MNTRADNLYLFRPSVCLKWRTLGNFDTDDLAKDEAIAKWRNKGGRLVVKIGDFLFPVGDLEGGKWIKMKARKSYDQKRNS